MIVRNVLQNKYSTTLNKNNMIQLKFVCIEKESEVLQSE